ncbi:hypothetical protein [Alkalimarinus sediminis]|uniref:Uncharacterized protein n=1 Tax=Alkalimarinus sediminis TaxID=1632866 RepID=A0A9E8KQ50_9ALTE|nr:hypothetical protein [Alkalimarinus sediminis]UZW76028.1 hypothetical protein NNL22_05455 [Alkalimarinus sediminis]
MKAKTGIFAVALLVLGSFLSQVSSAADTGKSNLDAFSHKKAKDQLMYLMAVSADRAQDRIKDGIVFTPYAAVFKPNGEIKYIELGEKRFDQSVAIAILHRSLRALAEAKKIATSAVYYTIEAQAEDGTSNRVLIAELEHAMGLSLINATPYKNVDGKVLFGQSVERSHEPKVMYDEPPKAE